jgi:transcriptional regulator with XRE-family HTH domain
LAERLNTDQQIISSWERDKAVPSRASLALLAEFFGMDVEALAQGKGFTIPDLPTSQDQPGSPLSRLLPKSRPGDLVAIPLSGGEPKVVTLGEAKALLVKVTKDARRAWIVFDPLPE